MSSTFILSLFLPYTIDFHDSGRERPPSPPPRRPTVQRLQSKLASGAGTAADLKASLFEDPTAPQSPLEQKREEFFAQFNLERQNHFKQPADRSVVRNDAFSSDFGAAAQYFNQPKSRAGPLPSGNILDYARIQEQVNQSQTSSRKVSPPNAKSSRKGSHERSFENKTWTVETAIQGNGGLTNAIQATASSGTGFDKIWVGTLGFPTDALLDDRKNEISEKLESEYESLTVFCTDRDLDGHYTHFCKTILWPVFHYQIPDHPKSKAYEDHSWKFYKAVNQAFADKVISSYKRGDIIWVNDYHLLLVPGMIRSKLPDAQIGFFLHTAFPSSEVFRCLSARKELLDGMLGANLVAFQTREYANHFLQTCARLLTVEVTGDGVASGERWVNVTHQPIGIDPAAMKLARELPGVDEWILQLQERYKGKFLIVARDQLDHVRGVRQKLLAFELFLNKYPQYRDKVVLIQVATSTTENGELLATVSDISTRIDSVYSTLAHQPLVFLKQDISIPQYVALLTVADCLMITSLREGMNLTPHEFVLCQDGTASEKKHAPIILSEFTGSAMVFGDSCLQINPWDYKQTADAIKTAVDMSEAEKERRHNKARNLVHHYTGNYWAENLVKELDKVHSEHYRRDTSAIPRLNLAQLIDKYKTADRRIFILDYEGTLASFGGDNTTLTPLQRVIDTLNELLSDRRNIVYVMSLRTPEDLQSLFHKVPLVGLIAENGSFLREYGANQDEWIAFTDLEATTKWKKDVRRVLQYYAERVEGSSIEERHCSLVFRYEKAEDIEAARAQAGDCANHINDSCDMYDIHAVPVGKSILVESVSFSKGTAATNIFSRLREKNVNVKGLKNPDFLMVAGDDREDETIFEWANELSDKGVIRDVTTVHVGKRNTCAKTTITQGTSGLLTVLEKLAKVSTEGVDAADYFSGRKASISAG